MKKRVIKSGMAILLFSSFSLTTQASVEYEDINKGDVELISKEKHQVELMLDITTSKTTYFVGEKGKLDVSTIEGVLPTGAFKSIKNDSIELETDGTFTALKPGKVEFSPEFLLSDESVVAIKQAYILNHKLSNVTVDEVDVASNKVPTPMTFDVNSLEKEKIDINVTPHFTIDKTNMRIGEVAKLSVSPINGIEVTGKFELSHPNDAFNVTSDGTVISKRIGEKMVLAPRFTISKESEEELFEAKKKELGDNSLTIDDVRFYTYATQQIFDMKVTGLMVGFVPRFHLEKKVINVGEKTKMVVEPIYGVDVTGHTNSYKNEFIEMSSDGTITGLKAGKTHVLRPTIESEEIQNELKKAYIKQEELTNVPVDGILLVTPSNIVSEEIEVIDPSQGNNNNVEPQNKSEKINLPAKTLPKTSESENILLILIGFLSIFGSALLLRMKIN